MWKLFIFVFFLVNIIESKAADSNLYNSQGYPNTTDSLYDTAPADSLPPETSLPKQDSDTKMHQDQLWLMKKEYKGNPANTDRIYYRQNENIKEINKDSTLKISPSTKPEIEVMSETPQYEFIINYAFKIVDEIPYGETYRISTPLNALNLRATKYELSKTCELNLKEKSFEVLLYPHYTQTQTNASLKKQMQFLLYNFLQDYKGEVLECLILNEARLDSMDTTINLESRTKTLTHVKSYMLVDFSGGILKLEVFKPKNSKY